MQKQNSKNVKKSLSLSRRTVLVLSALALLVAPASTMMARAASCRSTTSCKSQINNLRNQNTDAQSALNSLVAQAGSYQAAIVALQGEIDSLTQVIQANEAKQAQLQAEIIAKQAELDRQRQILGSDVKAMYVDDQMSTIEMLATSKNLSDYVDKEEYRQTVQNSIRTTMAQIAALQKQLQQQKTDIESLLAQQRDQENSLAADKSKQASLLSYNQSQQASFNAQIAANNAQIAKLRADQAALNAVGAHAVTVPASGGSGGACDSGNGNGGYPMIWCRPAQDSVRTSFGYSLNNRECTSYAYWYFTSVLGHTDFRVSGNANRWLATSSYPTHGDPAVNSIGVKTAGTYGHVVIVRALEGQTYNGVTVPSGEVLVSEMNYDWNGHFRFALRDVDTFAGFIY